MCVKEKALESLCIHFAGLILLYFGVPISTEKCGRDCRGHLLLLVWGCGSLGKQCPLRIKHLSSTFSNV